MRGGYVQRCNVDPLLTGVMSEPSWSCRYVSIVDCLRGTRHCVELYVVCRVLIAVVMMSCIVCGRHEDAMRALDASHEKRFFGSKVTVSIHDGVGKTTHTHTLTLTHSLSASLIIPHVFM